MKQIENIKVGCDYVELNISPIELVSINQKFISGKFIPSSKYTKLKKRINKIIEPYIGKIDKEKCKSVFLRVNTATDIDATVKPILDSLQPLIGDDKFIVLLTIDKDYQTRGHQNKLYLLVQSIECDSCYPLKQSECIRYKQLQQVEAREKRKALKLLNSKA